MTSAAAAAASFPAFFREILALPPGASTVSNEVDWLHFFVISTTMAGSVGVALVAFYWVVRYKQREPDQLTKHVRPSIPMELFRAGTTLGVFLAFWFVGFYIYLEIQEPPSGDDVLTVYVTAKQWMWKFSYPDGRGTNGVLVVPQGRRVKLVMTSRDVIHSFYVPAFRVKQDVLPGRYTTEWFEATQAGTFDVLCAEYCGTSHSLMRAQVVVLDRDAYAKWKETNTPAGAEGIDDLPAYGREVALRKACLSCHTIDGQPHVGPTWSRLYGSWVELSDGKRVKADDAYLTESMMQPDVAVVRGYRPIMPSYYGKLSHAEVAALVEFIRSLKSGPVPPAVDLPTSDAGVDERLGAAQGGPHEASELAQAPDAGTPNTRIGEGAASGVGAESVETEQGREVLHGEQGAEGHHVLESDSPKAEELRKKSEREEGQPKKHPPKPPPRGAEEER